MLILCSEKASNATQMHVYQTSMFIIKKYRLWKYIGRCTVYIPNLFTSLFILIIFQWDEKAVVIQWHETRTISQFTVKTNDTNNNLKWRYDSVYFCSW